MSLINLFIKYKYYFITGIQTTLVLSFVSLIIGTILGTGISLIRLSDNKILRGIATAYIEIVRGTPMMVQLSIILYGSHIVFGLDIGSFLAAIIAVSLNSAAYVAEIIRSGIQSIEKGQREASRSLGMSKNQTMRHVILPQAINNILPALGNEFITLVKETSVASTIGVTEIMFGGQKVQQASFQPFEPLIIIAIIYFTITFSLSKLVQLFERRLSHND